MSHKVQKSKTGANQLLLASCLAIALFRATPGLAAPEAPSTDPGTAVQPVETRPVTTKDELLLFWEEKDLYVRTATRAEKPLSQTAENVVVVMAKEIEDMNAHTLAEVLARVPGLFVDFSTPDFGSSSLLHIQGSADRHVTVLVDGVVWNFLSSANAETNSIPVTIIERIEIIKGPASSAWGSALGGVINVITKNAGETVVPKGTLSASFGEAHSQDYNAELYGKAKGVGYYLHAGRQDSKGLRTNGFERDALYGKVTLTPSRDLSLTLTAGYSNPVFDQGDTPAANLNAKTLARTFFVTGVAEQRLSEQLSLAVGGHTLRQKFTQPASFLTPAELFKEVINDEETVGGHVRLVYGGETHTAVAGAEASHGTLDQTTNAGPLLRQLGQPASVTTSPGITKWAIFANDTMVFGKLSVTPGIRLDHNDISGSFVSPSLGATYELGEHTVARLSVARGFTTPPLVFTSGGGLFLEPNPALREEQVWSYQAGIESGVTDYLNLKGTLFRHDMEDEQLDVAVASRPPFRRFVNNGHVVRQGYELGGESAPVHNVTLKAAFTYVRISADSASDGQDNYKCDLALKYDDRQSLMAQLAGTYVWWDLPAAANAKYNNFIWDVNASKRFYLTDTTSAEAFLAVHNLFSGDSYTLGFFPNPGRWVEGGVRFRF